MIGFIVKHSHHGLGKVIARDNAQLKVRFFLPEHTCTFASGISRALLPLDGVCETARGRCTIKARKQSEIREGPNVYTVEFENGLSAELLETELTLVESSAATAPLDALIALEQEGYFVFEKRAELVGAYQQMMRGGMGLRALLSSRIDLLPHQAYVAGVILLDRQQRYLLADEVGLGKTIEAGIVIHDVLGRNPDARILVLCPGALTQQWLCELYSKFSGRVFQLPEIRGTRWAQENAWHQTILSFFGAKRMLDQLLKAAWDLVVVDEAHHLLAAPELYALARQLSQNSEGFLLLSALPAQHREEEYLRLLALLQPAHYDPEAAGAVERFRLLYERQRQIGTRLGWISRRLPEVMTGERDAQSVLDKVAELAQWPVLQQDQKLQALFERIDPSGRSFDDDVRAMLHHVGDTHRINRRILRNRRARLIQEQQVKPIERRLNSLKYDPDQLELDALEYAHRFLFGLQERGLSEQVLLPLARQLLQASADPATLFAFLQIATRPKEECEKGADVEAFELDSLSGYAEWPKYAATLWSAAWKRIDEDALNDARRSAEAWQMAAESRPRLSKLIAFLKSKQKTEPRSKFVVFAGFPGLAKQLCVALCGEFTPAAVASFHHGMEDVAKEEQVRWFRRDDRKWILVCDETGGEGRNFQFAAELVHFDTPWHAAKVEQRIGRLDRLGRDRRDVTSNVLFCGGSEEEGLVCCLRDGFEIYARSISGLEFALRELERDTVRSAITRGRDGLVELPPKIRTAAEKERAEDESADVLDEASNERQAATAFRRVQSTPDRERALERAFADYFKCIANARAVHFCREPDYAEGIVLFQPEDVREVELGLRRTASGTLSEHRGTFYREIAQERPDLEFFSAGNSFFDAVGVSLSSAVKGRVYAVECKVGRGEWRGFEFAFRVTGAARHLEGNPGLLNQLDRIFLYRTEHIWVKDDFTEEKSREVLTKIRSSLTRDGKDRTWWNLTKDRAERLAKFYAEGGWANVVSKTERAARKIARKLFEQLLADALHAEHARLDEQERQLRALKLNSWEDEVVAQNQLRRAIDEWDMELDSVGFLSVNGGILR